MLGHATEGSHHVPVITENEIRSLAAVRSDGSDVTSCYLDVDGARYVRPADYQRALEQMVRRQRGDGVSPATQKDLARIEAVVKEGFDRSTVRGVAIFSDAVADLWRVIELPVPVRNQVVIDSAPAVGQLEVVLQQASTLGILAVDKARARVFVYRLGELIEHTEVTDDLGRDYDRVGEQDRGGVEEHREEMEKAHLRHAADLSWSAHQAHTFDHVAIAAPDHLATALERELHPYLRERLHSRLAVEPSAPVPVIRSAALELASRIRRGREAALVEELRSAAAGGGRGVAGLEPVLEALAEQRIDRLLVSDGYTVEGWSCPACGRLAKVGRMCSCGAEMHHVPDVVERAVDAALSRSCHVDVCDNADLDVMGRIGALLRY
jgi:peptide chain release factor subunit 1